LPVEAKPSFRPDVLRPALAGFPLPGPTDTLRNTLKKWADVLVSPQTEKLNGTGLLWLVSRPLSNY
jgi:hypothetical protein